MLVFQKVYKRLFYLKNKKSYFIFIALSCILAYMVHQLYFLSLSNNWVILTSYVIVASIISLLIGLMLLSKFLSNKFYIFHQSKSRVSKLKKRIIMAFSIGSAVPTILVAIFSVYFLNFGVEAWFDKKISNILNQSVNVGESYIQEHKIQLKETAISVANDLESVYYDLVNNSEIFHQVINAQAHLRSFDEGIVFQKKSNIILAQTFFSFSLAFKSISPELIERANNGDVVEINSDDSKIRFLIKLQNTDDTFLLIGRLIDPQIIDHIDKTNGATAEYHLLKEHILATQIRFSLVFIFVGFVLLSSAILWGRKFSEKIVRPITELVRASEKVKNGDLSAQVPLETLKQDEIKILSSSFNRMVKQLDLQQKELIVAQRSLAWSDVARRVAHEIKNPLTPIQLSAERLSTKFINQIEDKESFNKYVNNILRHSKDIKDIVSEFVEFARLPQPTFTKCDIYSLIKDLIESRQLVNNSIHYLFESNTHQCYLVCDVSQINRVLVNLMLNAEEALESKVKGREISVKIDCNKTQLIITVSDNGHGFSSSMLEQAKDAYVTTKSTGTGLGLSIVNRIVSDHFGEMHLTNNENAGGKITLIFDSTLLENQLK